MPDTKIYGVFGVFRKKKAKSVAHNHSLSLEPMLEYVICTGTTLGASCVYI